MNRGYAPVERRRGALVARNLFFSAISQHENSPMGEYGVIEQNRGTKELRASHHVGHAKKEWQGFPRMPGRKQGRFRGCFERFFECAVNLNVVQMLVTMLVTQKRKARICILTWCYVVEMMGFRISRCARNQRPRAYALGPSA